MSWESLAAVDVFQLERNEALLDSLYTFLEGNELTAAEVTRIEPAQLAKTLSVVQCIMKVRSMAESERSKVSLRSASEKRSRGSPTGCTPLQKGKRSTTELKEVKGEEAKVAVEELVAQQRHKDPSEGGAPNEQALMSQIVQLERELRDRDQMIEGLRERGSSPAPGAVNEARVLRQENEDLKLELGEVKRRLDNERGETDRLSGEAAAERLKTRQLQREIDQLHSDLDEYRKHMKGQGDRGVGGGGGGGGVSLVRAGEREYRERLRHKDLEIAEQLDKIEDLLNVRDDLERQRQELTEELGRAEEQRISCLRQTEEARQALVEAERHCREMENKNSLLEGQVADLRECLQEKTQAEQQTHSHLTEITNQWQSALAAKDSELSDYRDKLDTTQSQLTEAGKDCSRAAIIRMKKQLQDRDQEVAELQEEMARGAAALEQLSAQLEEERLQSHPTAVNFALEKALNTARSEAAGLGQALDQETERRRECEASSVEREDQLTQALHRLGEYERGEYGLREAVLEIKTKKEEIAIRDRDIAELTQQVNRLDRQVNQLSDFNEMLCERLGVGEGEEEMGAEFAKWRSKRERERNVIHEEKHMLQKEVERLKEDKLELRKRLACLRLPAESGSRGEGNTGRVEGEWGRDWSVGRGQDEPDDGMITTDDLRAVVAQLRSQVAGLYRECTEVRRERDSLLTSTHRTQHQDHAVKKESIAEMQDLKPTHHKLKNIEHGKSEEREVNFTKQTGSSFQPSSLPECIPMTSHDVISSLNEHLLHVLGVEKGRSQECEEMRVVLEKYQLKFSVIIDQLGILYKEYSDSKKEWEREGQQLQLQVRELEKTKLPLVMQLSQVTADLQQKTQTITDLRHETTRARERADVLDRSLQLSQDRLVQKERELSEAKMAVIRSEGAGREEREELRLELVEAQRGRLTAEEALRQLQALVSQKETQCEKYRHLLQEARSELHALTESHQSEVAALVKKLHAQSDSAVLKLKEVSMEAIAMPVVTGATEQQLARLHELEDLIGQQRVSYEARLADVRRESEQAKQDYETSLVRVRQEMGELKTSHFMAIERLRAELSHQSSRVVELEQELEVMSGELSAAQEAARQAPSKTTRELVEKLRQRLAVKDRQQKALNEALLQVRTELLDATQKTLLSHTQQEVTEVNLQRMVQKKTSELKERVQELSSKLNAAQTELERSRNREAEARQATDEAREALEQYRSEEESRRGREEARWGREREEEREQLGRLEGDLLQSRKAVEQGRAREQRLTRELQALQQQSDHRPEIEELQRKLNVLQTRFDRQKLQMENLRQQQKVVHVAVTPNRPLPPPAEEVAPLISIRHSSSSSEAVLKWEESKKWQRKVEGLRSKLADKTKEVESALGHVTSLRESLARSEHEKRLLLDKVKTLQKSISDLERMKRDAVPSGGSRGDGVDYHGDQGENHAPSLEELQRVISAMRVVVEKLQRENERLRREAATRRKREEGRGGGRAEEGRGGGKGEVDRGGGTEGGLSKQPTTSSQPQVTPVSKIALENERLRKSLKREMEQSERLSVSLKSAEIQTNRLKEELSQSEVVSPAGVSRQGGEEEEEVVVEQLRAEVEKKTQMLLEVKTHLREVAEREREREREHATVTQERDSLMEKVKKLHKELDAFDPSFFEEVEDLKFNYQEAVRRNVEYEQHIANLSQRLGASPPSINT